MASSIRQYECEKCPLRDNDVFRKFTRDELSFVSAFKSGELVAEAGTSFLTQGSSSAYVYTVLSGWGYRYKDLEDGRRQVLNFVFPGELVGLQGAVLKEMEHSVQAVSDMILCIFERSKLWDLYKNYPTLAYDITWLAAREEQMLEHHLVTVGKRTAKERLAYLVLHIFERAKLLGMTSGKSFEVPLTQQHVADTLGLSLVHTNKTLRVLYNQQLITWNKKTLTVLDHDRLRDVAKWEGLGEKQRPFI